MLQRVRRPCTDLLEIGYSLLDLNSGIKLVEMFVLESEELVLESAVRRRDGRVLSKTLLKLRLREATTTWTYMSTTTVFKAATNLFNELYIDT